MPTPVEDTAAGDVAVIEFGLAPVNSLGHATRLGIFEALERAQASRTVRAVVLVGRGGTFSAGADIREFDTPAMSRWPSLNDLVDAVESSPKPVVAAIEGHCLGGGFELALGCHYRVAASGAQIGLPEVKLGLLPGAGGTQRLPRLVGVETALNMIVSGEPVAARLLANTALIESHTDTDVRAAAIAFATELGAKGEPPKRVRDRVVTEPNLEALCQFARNTVRTVKPQYPAPLRCIDAIAAAAKPFDEGRALERSYFLELMRTPESKALRHAFFAERAAGRVDDVPKTTTARTIARAAVVGAGTMGTGITVCFLDAGVPVALLEADQAALDRGVARIKETYESQVRKRRITAEERDRRLGALTPTVTFNDLATADIVIEAVFEEMSVKRTLFEKLDQVMKPGAVLATNTSSLDVNVIAQTTKRPQDVVGTHFFSPANIMRLLEVVRGDATAPDVLVTAVKLAKTLRKVPVISGVCDGFIGNRMIHQYSRQAGFLLEEGATPQQVDAAVEAFGFAMGPFRMADLAGNDIGWHIRQRRALEAPEINYPKIADKLCELGRFGQKTQGGWYDYAPGERKPRPSKVVADLITAHRASLGLKPRAIDDREIVERLVYSLVNEGARLLEEKIAASASDIDVVYLTGYGFPVWRGGPMWHADQVGLGAVARRMREFAGNPRGDPPFWTPAPLLARLAAEDRTFNEGAA